MILHDGDANVDHLLIAFNKYDDALGRISGCLLRVHVNALGGAGLAPLNNVTMFRNHCHHMQTGPYANVKGGNSGRARLLFFGDGDNDEFRDMKAVVQENLCTDWSCGGPFGEVKYAGVTFQSNVLEYGTVSTLDAAGKDVNDVGGGNTPLQIRLRHGCVTQSATAAIDTGVGHVVDGNLWIRPSTSNATNGGVNIRDGYHRVTNNWAVELGPGVQPPASNPTVLAGNKVDIELLSGNLDWAGYPGNSTPGGGQNWPNCAKVKVGGNNVSVVVGVPSGNSAFKPDGCRVAPATANRTDRNHDVVTSAQTNPDTGTVVGADITKVPHRLQAVENGFVQTETEVGPYAWDASFYGS